MAVGIDRVERLLHSVKREENYYEKESNGYGNGSSNGNASTTTTGKVATGDSTSVAILLGVLMLAGAAVVVFRKKITH